jgi:hypothetical protein
MTVINLAIVSLDRLALTRKSSKNFISKVPLYRIEWNEEEIGPWRIVPSWEVLRLIEGAIFVGRFRSS